MDATQPTGDRRHDEPRVTVTVPREDIPHFADSVTVCTRCASWPLEDLDRIEPDTPVADTLTELDATTARVKEWLHLLGALQDAQESGAPSVTMTMPASFAEKIASDGVEMAREEGFELGALEQARRLAFYGAIIERVVAGHAAR